MSDNENSGLSHAGHAIGIGVLVALIGFAFGVRAARVFVAGVLVVGLVLFLALSFAIVTDRI